MKRLTREAAVGFLKALTAMALLVMLTFMCSTCRTMLKRDYRYEVTQERLDQAIRDIEALGLDDEAFDAAIKNLKSRYPVKKDER